uniref:Uncharacterized protein n=1 Tax=Clastoptera arizonana TaxID=38151 RepID=A0A1B6DJF7_9HEMI
MDLKLLIFASILILQINADFKKYISITNCQENHCISKSINDTTFDPDQILNTDSFLQTFYKLDKRNSMPIKMKSRRRKAKSNRKSLRDKYEIEIHQIAYKNIQKGNKIEKESTENYERLKKKNLYKLNRLGKMSDEEFNTEIALLLKLRNTTIETFKAYILTLNTTATQTKKLISESIQDIKGMSDVFIARIDTYSKSAETSITKVCTTGSGTALKKSEELGKELTRLMYCTIDRIWDVFTKRLVNAEKIRNDGVYLITEYALRINQDFKMVQTTNELTNNYIEYVLKNVNELRVLIEKKFQSLVRNCFEHIKLIINHNDNVKKQLMTAYKELFQAIAQCNGNVQDIKNNIKNIQSQLLKSNAQKYKEAMQITLSETEILVHKVSETITKIKECNPNNVVGTDC